MSSITKLTELQHDMTQVKVQLVSIQAKMITENKIKSMIDDEIIKFYSKNNFKISNCDNAIKNPKGTNGNDILYKSE